MSPSDRDRPKVPTTKDGWDDDVTQPPGDLPEIPPPPPRAVLDDFDELDDILAEVDVEDLDSGPVTASRIVEDETIVPEPPPTPAPEPMPTPAPNVVRRSARPARLQTDPPTTPADITSTETTAIGPYPDRTPEPPAAEVAPPPPVRRKRELEPAPARAPEPAPEPEPEPQPAHVHVPEPVAPTMFTDNALFRQEAQKLARAHEWQQLAAITSAAIDGATWANLPETRIALLDDLARLFRDRLKDLSSAEDTFRKLAQLDPAHAQAIELLSTRYRERNDWKALYDLYAAAIEGTFDPDQRLAWTRESVVIATERLRSPDLVVEAWERLWRLGDAVEETNRELSEVYRRTRRWDRLADFLALGAKKLKGAEKVVALREVAEAYLSGTRDHDKAAIVLNEILLGRPEDPIALLALARVLARRKDWEQLAELGGRPLASQRPVAVLDFRRLVADALWTAGDLDRSLAAHERVLKLDPDDADSLRAKEEYLSRTGRPADLVQFLQTRAERTKDVGARAELISRAAQLAEKELGDARLAVTLWEQRAAIPSEPAEAWEALTRLYEGLGDAAGMARSLEGQLAGTRDRALRIELLRRVGLHAAHGLNDDARAETAWREILASVPDDRGASAELLALYQRRKDFEGLDRTLAQQAWRALDAAAVTELWRTAAANVDQNFTDPRRSLRAWLRVLDLQPGDAPALGALTRARRALAEPRALVAALEAELLLCTEPGTRVAKAIEIARLWEAHKDTVAAIAAYERVLRWDPTDVTALEGLARLRGRDGAGASVAAHDAAAASVGDATVPAYVKLVRHAVDLAAGGDALARFHGLRRLLWLSGRDPAVLADAAKAAADAGAYSELAAVYRALAADATDPSERTAHQAELARIYEEHLKHPVRAYLALQTAGQRPVTKLEELDALTRLAGLTNRHEDLLAMLDVATRAEAPLATRQAALRQRAALCETQLGDAERAFQECARLLALDPNDAAALADARRLAAARKLWRELDALYAELWDRAGAGPEAQRQRIELARSRHQVRDLRLGDASGALDQLLVIYRLDPAETGIEEQLLAAAEDLGAWDRVLPVIEARVRSSGTAAGADRAAELTRVAALHEQKRNDKQRAFDLSAEAFVLRPDVGELMTGLERLAAATGHEELLAETYRLAAARCGDPERTVELYRRVAAIAGKVDRPDDALDVHRRILQLQPSAIESLDVVIDHQRSSGMWRELRDSLSQWIELGAGQSPNAPPVVARWLEIGRISREKLGDPDAALATYARILDLDPANEEAIAGVRSLTEGQNDPALELRRLRIELPRATGARRVEILLSQARIQAEEQDDPLAAIATLRVLCGETGADGPGYAPLARLLRAQKLWADLLDLVEARAAAIPDGTLRGTVLDEAIVLCDEHADIASDERVERLSKRILEVRPADRETRRRLLHLYRAAARHEDTAELLRHSLANELDQVVRLQLETELARVLDRGLGRAAEAEKVLAARIAHDPEALLAVASLKLRQKDVAGWLALREQHARRLPPAQGALALCHLAEACDEQGQAAKVATLYRDARTLDASCAPAVEALKAIGRRAKTWRAGAALLPDPDEARLSDTERAARLCAKGDAAANDPSAATGWYLRAVAVDPDHYPAWDAIARVRTAADDPSGALEAERASLAAFERSTAPEPARLRDHAERIGRLGMALTLTGADDEAARQAVRAWELVPSFAPAALAVAAQRLERGDLSGAHALYDRLLRDRDVSLGDKERLEATFQRGALAARLGRQEAAIADLRDALRIDSLHSGALDALADALAAKGRVAAAIQHYVQALLVAWDPAHRGNLYARLGRQWEDHVATSDEAAVCYDLALDAGVEERDIMLRALRLYRAGGRPDRALGVIERLLPATSDAHELAQLWTWRGQILAPENEALAMEAFDMALSYDPGTQEALGGLAAILEKRGEWAQLVDIYEARIEGGSPEERAAALRSLAGIAVTQLKDAARAERYLKAVLELAPTKADYDALVAVYAADPARADDRRALQASQLEHFGPWVPHILEVSQALAVGNERRAAWNLASFVASANLPQQVKTLVLELRKEFEKADNLSSLSPRTHLLCRHPDVDPAVWDLCVELDAVVALGPTTPEAVGATGLGKLDTRTAVGKTYAGIAARLGLDGALLSRAQELPSGCVVLDTEVPHLLVKAELLQLIPLAEINYFFVSMLEQARPGARLVCALPPEERRLLLPAVLVAAGLAPEGSAETDALAAKIRGGADAGKLADLAQRVMTLAPTPALAAALGERHARGVIETARRVGLIGAPDLRSAARLMTRLDESLPRMPTMSQLRDVDDFLAGAAPVRSLVAYAIAPGFPRLLAG